jgi:hypothetical protein
MNTGPLSPTNATAIAPRAWDTTAAKRRQAERLGSVEHIVTKIIAGLEKNIRHGCTDDNVTRIVAEWAGPLHAHVRVEGVRSQKTGIESARSGHAIRSKSLRLTVTNAAVLMELRPRLKQLQEALKPTGIDRVSF